MKKIKTYHLHSAIATIAGIAMGITLWSCSDTIEQDGVNPNMPCIELSFANESTSRADESVLGFTQTEKQMNTVDVFFYTQDKTTPVKVVHIDNTAHDAKHNIYIPGDSVEIIFGPEESADRTCRIYTVVNVSKAEYEKAGITKDDATISQLRNLKATTATFATTFNGFAMFTKSETGDVVTYDAQARRAAGVIKVKNLAAKIDLYANFGGEDGTVEGIDPTGTVQGITKWKIYKGTSNEAFIIDGVQSVPMNGWSPQDYTDGNLTKSLNGDDYFDTRTSTVNHYFKSSNETDKEKYPWVIAEPFYSYPNQWSADALEQHQTYLMLKVNWLPFETDENAPNVEDEIVETYYKIPINVSAGESKDKLLSNMYYRVKVNINTLGGINYGEPVELEDCSWEVLPWSEARLDADIHEIRWLEIKQKQTDVYDGQTYQAIMNNTSSVTLSYNSTHSIYLKSIKIQYYNFQTNDPYDPELVSVIAYKNNGKKADDYDNVLKKAGIDENVFMLTDEKLEWFKEQGEDPNGFYIDESNQTVTFYHSVYPLIGDNKSPGLPGKGKYYGVYKKVGDKTYSPFFIEFTLAHVDKPDFEKIYTIKQYPGVYVEFTKNTGLNAKGVSIGRRVPNGSGGTGGDNGSRFGIYVNGGATATWSSYSENDGSNCLQLGGIGGKGRASNQNMYSIHVTQLSDDEILKNLKYYDGNQRYAKDVTFHVGDPRTKFFNNNLDGDGDLVDQPRDVNDRWKATTYSRSSATSRNAFRKKPATKSEGGAQRLYDPHPNSDDKTTLCYYYPTAEGQLDEQAFMIAPVFRLASGKAELYQGDYDSDNLIRENARRRCASFQENGYPAGRWRLPTIGELYFFRMLYTKGILPEIFNTSRAYWTAQYVTKLDFTQDNANIRPYPTVSDVSEKHVRCVYDDWYWVKDDGTPDIFTENDSRIEITGDYAKYYGDSDKRTMFVWGDKEKNNPQQQPQ